MTGHTQLAITPRDRFMAAAQNELAAFERREREFIKKEREERAADLGIREACNKVVIDRQ
ncbi:hypothetical protein CP49_30155 [Bradyrhizobium valentinum]|uniref:Uncharacterized protein n=2 Tax=Bradyrhizobium valentinum TaxID=1518501 RepID=A0A0R3KR92_9BRAD|nr:hypothetical protein CP49_30155 [Bradyrhizobium valentinum]